MKTFEEYIFEVADERGFSKEYVESNATRALMVDLCEEANKRYTTATIKEHLSRAAENARMKRTPDELGSILVIDRESITNIDIILN